MNAIKSKLIDIYRFLFGKRIEKPKFDTIKVKKNQYEGQRCFIIGGGPSIKEMDLSHLNDEYTACVNKGYLLRELGLNSVNFYGCSDHSALKEYMHHVPNDFYENMFIFRDLDYKSNNACTSYFSAYTDMAKGFSMDEGFFQLEPDLHPCAHSYTIVLYMLQIIVWLGFKEVYFIGIDNDFNKNSNNHWYKDSQKETENIKVWSIDPCSSNEKSFEVAREILLENGVNIYNAGVGGKLNCLKRVSYSDLFSRNKENR
jgi:hypothetical protein